MKKECRIKHFPVSFFSMILGMAGFAIASQKAEQVLHMPIHFSWYILILTSAIFIIISIVYLIKIIRFNGAVKNEFNHPIKLSFFPTFFNKSAFIRHSVFVCKYAYLEIFMDFWYNNPLHFHDKSYFYLDSTYKI